MKVDDYIDKSGREWRIHRIVELDDAVWVAESTDGSGDAIEAESRDALLRAVEDAKHAD